MPLRWMMMVSSLLCLLWATTGAALAQQEGGAAVLGRQGDRFTINGKETFLLGISYYAGLGAPEAILRTDLERMRNHGFNWIRVWATWAAFGNDVSAVDGDGNPRPAGMKALRRLLLETERRGSSAKTGAVA